MNDRTILTADDIRFGGGLGGPEHVFRRIGEGRYRLTIVEHGIELDADRLRRDRHELCGELAVHCGIKGARTIDGCLSHGNFNFSSTQTRDRLASYLRSRARTSETIDWNGLLDELCIRIGKAEREGEPARLLREYDRPSPDDAHDVVGIPILKRHPILIFGDGGAAKSYLALFIAGNLAQLGVRVLYADWELAAEDHRQRLERLFGEDMPDIRYLRCQRPMIIEADSIKRQIDQFGIQYIICDSVAFATNGAPEAAEAAMEYFRAVRQFGAVGSLHIAHVTKQKDDDKTTNLRPFGSAFWHNSARSTWFIKRADDTAETSRITIGAYHQKANTGVLRPAVGLEFSFDAERTTVSKVDLADVADLAASLPLWRRCMGVVKHGAQTIAAIADELNAKPDSVEKAMKRSRMFTCITSNPDGVHRWGLAERRVS